MSASISTCDAAAGYLSIRADDLLSLECKAEISMTAAMVVFDIWDLCGKSDYT